MKIIFHIGAGKTGTSSIQGALNASKETLAIHGVKYLGLMLEQAPAKLYAWQQASAIDVFQALSHEEAGNQVEQVLLKTMESLQGSGIHTLVWSNEWFFGRHRTMLNPMKRLAGRGYDVRIVAYVRRHDAWARSAYKQWGIKHKTYEGKLVSFSEYVKKRPVGFSKALMPWAQAFGENLIIRNFDASRDAVTDFCAACGIDDTLLKRVRVNDSPGAEEMLLRALFNNRQKGVVGPEVFDRLFQADRLLDFTNDPITWMNDLLPSEADLKEVQHVTAEDQEQINALLAERGEPALSFETTPDPVFSVNHDIVYGILFHVLAQQAAQLRRLRNEVWQLKNRGEA